MDNDYQQRLLEEDLNFYGEDSMRREKARADTAAQPEQQVLANPSTSQPAADQTLNDQELLDEGPKIEIPHRGKLDYFPALTSRSALFRASQTCETFQQLTEIPSQGSSMRVLGPRLSMRDKSIWEIAMQLAKESAPDMSKPFEVSLREFVRRLGSKDVSGPALESIWGSLSRLCLTRIEFVIKGQCSGVGSMLSTAIKQDGRCYLRLNPDFAIPALTIDHQFRINSQRRMTFSSALTQWLHDFLSTHTTTRDMDLRYLRGLSGYDGTKRNFAGKLKQALDELVKHAPELVAKYEIIRGTRDSDEWTLRIQRGAEQPQYVMPSSSTPMVRGRRGGVAL